MIKLDDRIRDKCGVFGVFGHEDSSALTALGLHALQHRGQESAGIVSFDGKNFNNQLNLGLVGDYFTKEKVIKRLPFADLLGGGLACAHNGNLTNGIELRKKLVREGSIFQSTSDTEAFIHLISKSREKTIVKKIIDALYEIKGAYSFGILTNKKLIGIRDPLGIRPLVIGSLGKAKIISSRFLLSIFPLAPTTVISGKLSFIFFTTNGILLISLYKK